jgi:hypothetical protein
MARRREKTKKEERGKREETASPVGARIRGGAERAGGQAGGGWVGFGAGLARAEGICNGVRCYFSLSSSSLARSRCVRVRWSPRKADDKTSRAELLLLGPNPNTLPALRWNGLLRGVDIMDGMGARGRSVKSGGWSYLGDMLAAEFASRRRHLS